MRRRGRGGRSEVAGPVPCTAPASALTPPVLPLPSLTSAPPVGSASLSVPATLAPTGRLARVLLARIRGKPGDKAGGAPIPKQADGSPDTIGEHNINTSVVLMLCPGRVPRNRLLVQLGRAAVFQFPISAPFPGLLRPSPAGSRATALLLWLAGWLGTRLCAPAPVPAGWGHRCEPVWPASVGSQQAVWCRGRRGFEGCPSRAGCCHQPLSPPEPPL